MNKHIKGFIYALAAAGISSISIYYAKISVTKIDPIALAMYRNAWAGLLFLIPAVISLKAKKQTVPWLAALSGSIPFALFFMGLKLVGALQANLIQKSMFLFASVFAFYFLKEKISKWMLGGYTIIILALSFSGIFSKFSFNGLILIFLAVLFWSAEQVYARWQFEKKNVDTNVFGLVRMLGGSILLFLFLYTSGKQSVMILKEDQLAIVIIGGSLLFGYVSMWLKALSYVSVSVVTFVLTIATVFGIILQFFLIGGKVVLPVDILYSAGILALTPLCIHIVRTSVNYERV